MSHTCTRSRLKEEPRPLRSPWGRWLVLTSQTTRSLQRLQAEPRLHPPLPPLPLPLPPVPGPQPVCCGGVRVGASAMLPPPPHQPHQRGGNHTSLSSPPPLSPPLLLPVPSFSSVHAGRLRQISLLSFAQNHCLPSEGFTVWIHRHP